MSETIVSDKGKAAERGASHIDLTEKWWYRVGSISSLAIGIGYIVIVWLYAYVGAPPAGGEARLKYLVGHATTWWAILGLSVLTDALFVPVTFSLYLTLRGISRNAMLVAATFVGLFVVLDLAVTWPNYAALIALSGNYAAATSEAQRTVYIAAANYASAVLTSSLEAVYSILTLSLGILVIGLVMLRGRVFNRGTAYVGVATGVLGVISVAGPLFVSALSSTIIITSVLTIFWVLLVGYGLYRLGEMGRGRRKGETP